MSIATAFWPDRIPLPRVSSACTLGAPKRLWSLRGSG
jgi:hypothetical protein